MVQWIEGAFSVDRFGPAIFPAAFLLGMLGALTSCCTLPVIGAVAGYAGTCGEKPDRRRLMLAGLFFLVGTILSLVAFGAVAAFVGSLASASLGRYTRVLAGFVTVLFGLAALRLLPFRFPTIERGEKALGGGTTGAMIYGLTVGGATTACTVSCNPLLAAAVGAATMKGAHLVAAAVMILFALGYSLPLAAALVGVGLGLGSLSGAARRAMSVINVCAGLLLVGVGFYLLAKK